MFTVQAESSCSVRIPGFRTHRAKSWKTIRERRYERFLWTQPASCRFHMCQKNLDNMQIYIDIWYMKKQSETKILLPLHFTPFEWNWNPCKWIVIAHPLSRFVSSFQDSQLKRDSIQMWFSLWHQITFRWQVKWQCQENQQNIIQNFDHDLGSPVKIASAPRWNN